MRDQAFTSMKGKQILQFACVELGYLNDLMILNLGTSVISTNTRTVPVPPIREPYPYRNAERGTEGCAVFPATLFKIE